MPVQPSAQSAVYAVAVNDFHWRALRWSTSARSRLISASFSTACWRHVCASGACCCASAADSTDGMTGGGACVSRFVVMSKFASVPMEASSFQFRIYSATTEPTFAPRRLTQRVHFDKLCVFYAFDYGLCDSVAFADDNCIKWATLTLR